jgi:hypothetical protein
MPRSQWGASPPKNPLDEFGDTPAEYIIISHVMVTETCTDTAANCANMRLMQQLHQTDKGQFSHSAYSSLKKWL